MTLSDEIWETENGNINNHLDVPAVKKFIKQLKSKGIIECGCRKKTHIMGSSYVCEKCRKLRKLAGDKLI